MNKLCFIMIILLIAAKSIATERKLIQSISKYPIILENFDPLDGKTYILSSNGERFAQIDLANNINIWDIEANHGKFNKTYLRSIRQQFKDIKFSFKNSLIILDSFENTFGPQHLGHLLIHDQENLKIFDSYFAPLPNNYKSIYSLSQSEKYLGVVPNDGDGKVVEVWDLELSEKLWDYRFDNNITALKFSPSDNILAVKEIGISSGDINLFNRANGHLINKLEYPEDFSDPDAVKNPLLFSENEKNLMSCSSNINNVAIWNIENAKLLHKDVWRMGAMSASPNGKYLVYVNYLSAKVIMWNTEKENIEHIIEPPESKYTLFTQAVFSPNSDYLVFSYDRTIIVYCIPLNIPIARADLATGQRIEQLIFKPGAERVFLTRSNTQDLAIWQF